MKSSKKIFIIIITLLITLLLNNIVYGKDVKTDNKGYSKAYLEYLALSDEEKKNVKVIPRMFEIPIDSIYENTVKVEEPKSLFNLFGLLGKTYVADIYSDSIPDNFDLRSKINIATKNQSKYNLCWDFASTRCLETNLALHGYGEYDFSENYVDYLSSEEFGSDGGFLDGGGAFERWKNCVFINGIVLEETVPLGREYSEDEYSYLEQLEPNAFIIETVDFPTIDKISFNYTDAELNLFRQKVKKHIMENGSVYAAIETSSLRYSYDTDYTTLYHSGASIGNHAVSIIGWDDNFSKKNFLDDNGNMPQNDGAYIAMNSWGTNDEIIYISYDDSVVELMMSGVKDATTNKNDIEIGETSFKDVDAYNCLKLKIKKAITSVDENNLSIRYLKNAENANLKLNLDNKEITDLSGFKNFTVLQLSAINIKLSSLNTLSGQKGIKFLYLNDNEIQDITTLEQFDLMELDLSNNKIQDINALSNQKHIKVLSLNENQIENITALKNVNNLYSLSLSNNKISNIETLSSQEELEILSIYNNKIEDITPLSNLTKLTGLELSNNKIEDIAPLSNLTKLTSLGLSNNRINGIEYLKDLDKLNYLILSDNEIEDITVISNLKELETLFLDNNRIEDITPLSNLTKLTSLGLSNNKIEDITSLLNLTNIEELRLYHNEITLKIRNNDSTIEVEIPQIIKETLNPESKFYSQDGYTFCNCEFDDNNEKLLINNSKESNSIESLIQVNSGIAAYTSFKIININRYLHNLNVISLPNKTEYIEGQNFNQEGMIITAIYDDETTKEITDYIVTDGNSLTTGKANVTISYTENGITKTTTQNITVKAKALTGIAITTAPTRTSYVAGQNFEPAGMVVTASYNDGSSKAVTNYTVTDGNSLTAGKTSVTISYTENGITKTTTQNITVVAKALTGIAVTTSPTRTSYVAGQNFETAGMIVTASYNDGSSKAVTNYTVTDGNNLTAGKTNVTISYTDRNVTKTAIQNITVSEKLSIEIHDLEEVEKDGKTYIELINPGATVKSLTEKIETNGTVEIFKETEKITNVNTKLATGMTLKISLNNEQKEYIIVVTGDLNGDGEMGDVDVLRLARYRAGLDKSLTGAYLQAANIFKDDNYADDIDLLKIVRILVGLDSLTK